MGNPTAGGKTPIMGAICRDTGALAITVERRPGERFDRIVAYRLGDKPPRLDSEEGLPEDVSAPDEGVPF